MSRHGAIPTGSRPTGAGAQPASSRRHSRRATWAALLAGALLWIGSAPVQAGVEVCRVKNTGTSGNDGSSWTQALDLPSALGNPACAELWVAEGVHKPTTAADRGISFAIRPGVAVYGGFAGTETRRDQRDPAMHRSVLSGDIDGNDIVDEHGVTRDGAGIVGDNAYHVVWLGGGTAADTVLDGFILTGGLANGNDVSVEHGGGGGLICSADGAGQACSPTLRNLTFRGNAGISGGGVGCLAQNQGTCSPRLENVAFVGNYAFIGGGMLSAGVVGGSSHPVVENATFSGNRSAQGGGGFGSAGTEGGSSHPILRNVTFSGNEAISSGSAGIGSAVSSLAMSGTSHVRVVNAILWGDVTDELAVSGGTATLKDSIVQGGCPAGVSCTGLLAGDPRLGALLDGGVTPVLPIGADSAAIDAVACDDAPAGDQRGVARPQGRRCDIGAMEVRQARLDVDVSGNGKVDAAAAPSLLGAPIADCRQDSGICAAWYRAEPDAPAVTLTLHPDAGQAVQSATGCDGSLGGGGFTFATGALDGDCTVAVAFAPAVHAVGGTVTGLAGSGLVLVLNGSENLPVATDGTFVFDTAVPHGSPYDVVVANQPNQPPQSCVVVNGNGTVGDADITDVVVHCGAEVTYTVGGTLSGLAAGASVALSINGGAGLVLAADGAYAFSPRFVPGDGYVVAVTAQPAGQHCTLGHAEGTVGIVDVTDVDVDCTAGGAHLQLAVTDGGDYARYGQVRAYFVTLSNTGNGSADGVAIGADLDAAFDLANLQWTCVGGTPGTACSAQGAGGFADTATLPPGTSLTWIVRAPIRGDSAAATATFLARASGAADAGDTDTLVLFRDGVDVPYADGARAVDPASAAAAPGVAAGIVIGAASAQRAQRSGPPATTDRAMHGPSAATESGGVLAAPVRADPTPVPVDDPAALLCLFLIVMLGGGAIASRSGRPPGT